jgi:hypothetical protein
MPGAAAMLDHYERRLTQRMLRVDETVVRLRTMQAESSNPPAGPSNLAAKGTRMNLPSILLNSFPELGELSPLPY